MISLLLASSLFLQQEDEAARKLLQASAAALRKGAALSCEISITRESAIPGDAPKPEPCVLVLKRPNFLRFETEGEYSSSLVVSDGRTLTRLWKHSGAKQEYSQYPVRHRDAARIIPRDPVVALYLGPDALNDFESADELRVAKEKLGSEDCDVVSGIFPLGDPYGSSFEEVVRFRIWIGKDRLPRKSTVTKEQKGSNRVTTSVYAKFNLDAKPAADAFSFTPPAGAIHMNRKANRPEDIPSTEAAKKAQEVLVAVQKNLRTFEAVQYERVEGIERDGRRMGGGSLRTTLKRPRQLRSESVNPGSRYAYIIDGETRMHVQEFDKQILGEDPDAPDMLTSLTRANDPLIQLFFQEGTPLLLAGASDVAMTPDKVGAESCDLISWVSDETKGAIRLWVGPDGRVRKFAQSTGAYNFDPATGKSSVQITGWMTSSFKSFDPAPKLSEDFFAFKAPPDWRDTRKETKPVRGMAAPDFECVDRDGKSARLADFRGKSIVLVFLDDHNPFKFDTLQKLHEEFAPRIAVIGVFAGREAPKYDPDKHKFRLLTPADDSLKRAFAILHDQGDFLIDQQGKIYFAGVIPRPESLRFAVKRLR